MDKLRIEILDDGTIRTTTDNVSAANHANAEAFLRYLAELAGGSTTRTRRAETATQAREHEHAGHSH